MGQAMVAIVEDDCTGCDLCILHCPFEALLAASGEPAGTETPEATGDRVGATMRWLPLLHRVVPHRCPVRSWRSTQRRESPLVFHTDGPATEAVVRWKKRDTRWP